MKKLSFLFAVVFLLLQTGTAFAQNTDDEVVKISTNVVQVDATVTDKNGVVVRDLKPTDFEIYENGKKRAVTGFSFVSTASANVGVANGLVLSGANSKSAAASLPAAAQVGNIYAIIIEDIGLSRTDVESAKKEVVRFIQQQVAPNDLVAIIKTSTSVGVLQKFTSDKAQLLRQVEEIEYRTTALALGRFAPVGISFSDQIAGNSDIARDPSDPNKSDSRKSSPAVTASRTDIEATAGIFKSQVNAIGGLQVLRDTVNALGYLKGRKTLLYLSSGFSRLYTLTAKDSFNSLNDTGLTIANENSLKIGDRSFAVDTYLRAITELANRNSVAIFPIDPSGAVTTNLASDDNTRKDGLFNSNTREETDAVTTGRNFDVRASQETLKYLARETGGKALINKNDYGKDLKAALDQQKGYYLLAYEPDAETFDPKDSRFNKLEVKVVRPNLNVAYRSGFFNVSTGSKQNPATAGDAILQRLYAPYNYADIGIDATSIYAGADKNSSTIRSFINVSPNNLSVSDEAAGARKSVKFDLVAAVFNDAGVTVGSSARNYEVAFEGDSYDAFLKSGIVSNLTFAIQKPGTYRVKILVKDSKSGKIGTTSQTIFVPDAEKQPVSFSGFLLQNYTAQQWQDAQKNPSASAPDQKKMQTDTAFRHFKKGTVLTFTYAVNLSPDLAKNGNTKLTLTTKLLKDNQTVFGFAPEEIPIGAASGRSVSRRSAFNVSGQLQKGKYTLVTVADADKTHDTETQTIDFEVVE